MSLYKVTYKYSIIVEAEDEDEAYYKSGENEEHIPVDVIIEIVSPTKETNNKALV